VRSNLFDRATTENSFRAFLQLEIGTSLVEGRGGAGLMFTRTRTRIEAAAPFPPISIVRITDTLGDRNDMNIAEGKCASSYGGGLRIGGG